MVVIRFSPLHITAEIVYIASFFSTSALDSGGGKTKGGPQSSPFVHYAVRKEDMGQAELYSLRREGGREGIEGEREGGREGRERGRRGEGRGGREGGMEGGREGLRDGGRKGERGKGREGRGELPSFWSLGSYRSLYIMLCSKSGSTRIVCVTENMSCIQQVNYSPAYLSASFDSACSTSMWSCGNVACTDRLPCTGQWH